MKAPLGVLFCFKTNPTKNMPNSQPQELIAAQIIDDPFSMEFMETANTLQVSADSLASLPKRRVKVARDKFVLHKDLKTRLTRLLASNCSQQAKTVAEDILNLKYVPLEGKYCNYLGLSQADYTKISYLDKDREERLAGQETTMEMIRPGTVAKFYVQRSRRRSREQTSDDSTAQDMMMVFTLKLTARHLSDRVYPIDRTEEADVHFVQEFWDDSPTKNYSFSFKNTHLAQEAGTLRIQNSRTRGADGFTLTNNGVILSGHNWERLLAVEFENTSVTLKEVWNFKKRYHTSIGKIVRRLFADKYSDREVTAFAEAYASLITVSNPLYDFQIIEGEDIKDAYYEDNYYQHSGTLGNSCMRYYNCQRYFQIYTKYPDKVKMAILKRSGKIAARCIMWNIEGKFMFDRIYYTTDETHNLLKNTLTGAGYETLFQVSGNYSLNIDLTGINQFPYVDTLCNYDPHKMLLTNQHLRDEYWQFRSTGGCFSRYNVSSTVECHSCGEELDEDDATYLTAGEYEGQEACSNCYIYCEADDSYISTEDDAVETYDGETVLTSRSIRLNNGEYAHQNDEQLREYENGFGYFILDEEFYFTDGNSFYHKNDPNIPEDAYDSQEADRRAEEELQRRITENIARAEAQASAQAETAYTLITSNSATSNTFSFNNVASITYLNSTGLGINIHGSLLSSGSSSVEPVLETLEEMRVVEPDVTETTEVAEVTEVPLPPNMEISLEEVRNDSEAMEASAQGEAEFTTWSQIIDEALRDFPL